MKLLEEMGKLHRKKEWSLDHMKRYQILLKKFSGGDKKILPNPRTLNKR